jgi:hypothetical protein
MLKGFIMSLKFIETDHGWISDRFIVRMIRGRTEDDFKIIYFDGTATASALTTEKAVSEYLHQSGQDRLV